MSGESQLCRICGLSFVTGIPDDSEQHREMHAEILRGGLPLQIREMLKSAGYATIAGQSLGFNKFEIEEGKQAVVFGWWTRARANGIPDSELNDFFAAHLSLLDGKQNQDEVEIEEASKKMKRWEKFAG
jgi:hypothetical protein